MNQMRLRGRGLNFDISRNEERILVGVELC